MAQEATHWKAFVKLGKLLRDYCNKNPNLAEKWKNSLDDAVVKAHQQNGWFTHDNVLHAFEQWGKLLTEDALTQWLSAYPIPQEKGQKTIGIIMAGNIPLVGFHDFLSVLVTGNRVLAKLSSNDKILLPTLANYLFEVEPSLEQRIRFTEEKLVDFDAVIATGSNNTSRYFEYYFGKYPNIIRKNRNSVAVLQGNENKTQLAALGEDIFRYFGLGCRSVSKVYVPKGYDFNDFFEGVYPFKAVVENHKYANNYDYNKAVYLMSEFKILDNGFLILNPDTSLSSPIATLNYEEYSNSQELQSRLDQQKDELQCIVANDFTSDEIAFGHTQQPKLDDYADGKDTLKFLLDL